MLAALTLSLPLLVLVYAIQGYEKSKTIRVILIVLCCLMFSITAFFWYPETHLGTVNWWEEAPWKQTIMYILMILGMELSVLNKAIEKRKNIGSTLKIDKWNLLRPLLLSWITYGVLNSQIGDGSLNVASVILSIQTGFVWETVVGRVLKEAEG
jgi:hypothetical protein